MIKQSDCPKCIFDQLLSAENAMEQLATGLNRAAETMQSPETGGGDDPGQGGAQPVPDVAELQDQELYQLLEEAYAYKRPKDRQGKSEMFRVSRSQMFNIKFCLKTRLSE